MPEFTAKAGFAGVHFSVHNNAEPQAPAQIEVEQILNVLIVSNPLRVLAVGHATRIVINGNG